MKPRTEQTFVSTALILQMPTKSWKVRYSQRRIFAKNTVKIAGSQLGILRGTIVVLILAEPEPDVLRVISLRKATANEQKNYTKALQDGLEADRFNEGQRH